MSVYRGTPTKLRVTTPKGKILLRGEQDSSTVMTVLTSPTRSERKELYFCENDWETLGDSYGLEVDTERKDDEDLNNGRCFRERIRVQDSEKTLVGGEWGDQFHVAYIDGVKPVLIQIKCKDDDLTQEATRQEGVDLTAEAHLTRQEDLLESTHENITECSNNNLDNKDVYLMYYIEQETSE
jgi:hypothetical protein